MEKVIQRKIWSPSTYSHLKQYIQYFSRSHPVFERLSSMPPIVSIEKIKKSQKLIKDCEEGKSTLLHIGDCAEPFEHAQKSILKEKIAFLKQCKNVLSLTKNKPAHIIGRIAGQYAKPRSNQYVNFNGTKIHNYKGDNINGLCQSDRNPCDKKLLQGYYHALNAVRIIQKQFPELFVSHEGLVLPYEQSLTREQNGQFYCQSAHMIWIGERTRQLDGAHVQFFRGLQNPIGIKISSNFNEEQFINLTKTLNPENKKGKLLVIVRMGKQKIKKRLQALINIKQKQSLNFLFMTDPMHGNTFDSKQAQLKTRNLQHILQEIKYFEQKMNQKKLPYGYSLESTFEDVTQCYGLQHPLNEKQLKKQNFKSKCDPRLNRSQTLKLLSLLSKN